MFSHLVESDLHKGEIKRKGKFFLATMAAYALVLTATGLVGVYAYEARIDDQNLELVALVPPDTEEPKPREVQPRPRASTPSAPASTGGQRITGGLIKNTPSNVSTDLTKIAGAAQTATTQTPPILSDGSGRDFVPGKGNPFGVGNNSGGDPSGTDRNGGGNGILKDDAPPITKKQEPPEKIKYIGVANSRAINLPQPVYPQLARTAGIEGMVTVEILIDEMGRVMTAQATSGNPLLRQEAERAAARARFTPTTLSNQPVKAK
ncbi:MAG TPA: TonB family protein, partial [Pyrinomonadaceae bacterium]|nr:TonB family protein [Pyrinomonadaceae bacterium]